MHLTKGATRTEDIYWLGDFYFKTFNKCKDSETQLEGNSGIVLEIWQMKNFEWLESLGNITRKNV